jgi:hypothetical protein
MIKRAYKTLCVLAFKDSIQAWQYFLTHFNSVLRTFRLRMISRRHITAIYTDADTYNAIYCQLKNDSFTATIRF